MKIRARLAIVAAALGCAVAGTAIAGSLYDPASFRSLTADRKARQVGDLVTVLIYENASASALVDMPAVKKSHNLLSFGVGYTNSPPGTVDTVVSSVMFRDVKYDLTCKPKPSASPSKSALPSNSSAPAVVPAGNQATLPITGSKVPAIVGAGVLLILAGALLAYAVRRRRTEFR
jgi:LPXTG-motif cell wall-anchored protein